jgi:hypothetical protein
MERLNELIDWLTNMNTGPIPNSKFHISNASRNELVEMLDEIREELRAPTPAQLDTARGHTPASKYALEVGVPFDFNGWVLEKFDILSEPNEVPKLNATYVRI